MLSKGLERLLQECREELRVFEEFDQSGRWPYDRIVISLSLRKDAVDKLRLLARERKEKLSHVVEKAIMDM